MCTISASDDQLTLTADCSGNLSWNETRHLVPDTTTKLLLQNNSLYHIPTSTIRTPSALVYLDLSWNLIAKIDKEDFANLTRLRTLKLSNNRLCLGYDSFPATAFQHLTMLRTLFLHANRCQYSHRTYPDLTLAELPKLEYLSMSALRNVDFGVGFLQLRHLRTLSLIGYSVCHIDSVSRTTFQNLRNCNLTHLEIKSCNLTNISNRAFRPLKRLTHINLACNRRMGFNEAVTALSACIHCRFHTVILDALQDSLKPTALLSHMFKTASMRPIRRLTIRANFLFSFDVRSMHHLSAIKYLAWGYNCPRVLLPKLTWGSEWLKAQQTTTLETLEGSHWCDTMDHYYTTVCLNDDMLIEDYFRNPNVYQYRDVTAVRRAANRSILPDVHYSNWWRRLPVTLKYFYFDSWTSPIYLDIPRLELENNAHWLLLNISYVTIRHIIGPLIGLSNIQVVDIRHSGVESIAPNAFRYLEMLRFLFLQENRLGTSDEGLEGSFAHLRSLEELDLRHNALTRLHHATFSDLVSLRTLRLDWNSLADVNFSTSGLTSLQLLNLAHNSIAYLNQQFLAELVVTLKKTNFHIDLSDNFLMCACKLIPLLSWYEANGRAVVNFETLTCNFGDVDVRIQNMTISRLADDCPPVGEDNDLSLGRHGFVSYSISVACTVLAILLLTLAAYLYRWKIHWRWYILRRHFRNWGQLANARVDGGPVFDAFVSFRTASDCDDDRWVANVLLPRVEREWGLHMCVIGRNDICDFKANTIIDAVRCSRRTIVVLSSDACGDAWCNYAFNMATEKEGDKPLLICLQDFAPALASKAIRKMMFHNEQLNWSDDSAVQAAFWKKLKIALKQNKTT